MDIGGGGTGFGGISESPVHGDGTWVEITCGDGLNQGGRVGPAHWWVAGKYMSEDLIKLGLKSLTGASIIPC